MVSKTRIGKGGELVSYESEEEERAPEELEREMKWVKAKVGALLLPLVSSLRLVRPSILTYSPTSVAHRQGLPRSSPSSGRSGRSGETRSEGRNAQRAREEEGRGGRVWVLLR